MDVNKRLVAGKKAVPASQQIPFEPPLAHMLAKDFRYATVRGEMLVYRKCGAHEDFVSDFK
jgi:hypothetical protein